MADGTVRLFPYSSGANLLAPFFDPDDGQQVTPPN
jgi:hypothetical protein